jgi:hypothetical protein
MNVPDMRDHVRAMYPESTSWGQRVRQMPDEQIIAIYKSKIERASEAGKSRKENEDEKQLEFPF